MYIKEPGRVEFIDVEKPVRKKGGILLKLLYKGICGGDLGSCKGTFAYFDYPRIPGRELSAEIAEAGEGDEQGLYPGMIVTCNLYFNCGYCYSCEGGIIDVCMNNQTMGCQRDGAFQEYITMPSGQVYDGEGIGPMLLAVIGPFCTSCHGVSRVEVGTGEEVLVTGARTIEVPVAVVVKAKDALVYMSNISGGELGVVKAFGVGGIILNGSPENSEKAVNDIAKGNGLDTTIKVVGFPSIFQNRIDAACFGGKVVVIGVGEKNLDFSFTLLRKKELDVLGSRSALKKDFVELVDLVKSGETPVESIITSVYKFENRAGVFYDFAHNPGDMLEVVVDLTGN